MRTVILFSLFLATSACSYGDSPTAPASNGGSPTAPVSDDDATTAPVSGGDDTTLPESPPATSPGQNGDLSEFGIEEFPAADAAQSIAACQRSVAGKVLPEGRSNDAITQFPRPDKGLAFVDPNYGTCMMRVTSHSTEPPIGFARNDYPRRQPFNADDSKFFVSALDGAWHLYDAVTYKWIKKLVGPAGDAEPQWHPTDPNLLLHLPNNGFGMKIFELNVSTDASRVVADLAPMLTARWPNAAVAWTKSEGSPSADLRYWSLLVEDDAFETVGFAVWDMQEQRVISFFDTTDRPDYVSMSPSGKFVLIGWNEQIVVFDRNFTNRRELPARIEHADIAIGSNGNDIYVAIDYNSNDGSIIMIDLETGVRTKLEPTYINGSATAFHFSGKGFNRPGWVLVSSYARESGEQEWIHEKVFALELKSEPRIIQLAHHYSVLGGSDGNADYFREPHAAINRDFTRVLFTSNWGNTSELDVDAYMVLVPADALPQ